MSQPSTQQKIRTGDAMALLVFSKLFGDAGGEKIDIKSIFEASGSQLKTAVESLRGLSDVLEKLTPKIDHGEIISKAVAVVMNELKEIREKETSLITQTIKETNERMAQAIENISKTIEAISQNQQNLMAKIAEIMQMRDEAIAKVIEQNTETLKALAMSSNQVLTRLENLEAKVKNIESGALTRSSSSSVSDLEKLVNELEKYNNTMKKLQETLRKYGGKKKKSTLHEINEMIEEGNKLIQNIRSLLSPTSTSETSEEIPPPPSPEEMKKETNQQQVEGAQEGGKVEGSE